jgi:hypothetical protein
MTKINTSFARYKDSDLSTKAEYILFSMTGNANYLNPVVSLAAIATALQEYNDALAASMSRNSTDVAVKKEKRQVLMSLLNTLGIWVQMESNVNAAVLKSSGYDVAKAKAPVGILPKPERFVVKPGEAKGSVKLRIERTRGAKSYEFKYTKAPLQPNCKWESIIQRRTTALIPNLTSGQAYIFKAVAIGANPVRVYSDEVSTYVL